MVGEGDKPGEGWAMPRDHDPSVTVFWTFLASYLLTLSYFPPAHFLGRFSEETQSRGKHKRHAGGIWKRGSENLWVEEEGRKLILLMVTERYKWKNCTMLTLLFLFAGLWSWSHSNFLRLDHMDHSSISITSLRNPDREFLPLLSLSSRISGREERFLFPGLHSPSYLRPMLALHSVKFSWVPTYPRCGRPFTFLSSSSAEYSLW